MTEIEKIRLVAMVIAAEHKNRKPLKGIGNKQAVNEAYAVREWKTFVPAAVAVLKTLEPLDVQV